MADKELCEDKNCPKHGNLSARGMTKNGKIVSKKMKRTVIVEMDIVKYLPKYKRWAKDKSKMAAHCPDCMNVKLGDMVVVRECRKLSKTKAWVVTEVLGEKK